MYGAVPPLPDSVVEYAAPRWAGGTVAGVMSIKAGEMLKEYACEAETEALSVAVTVNAKFPELVGVPLSTPPTASAKPGGSEPAVTANVKGAVPVLLLNVWL